jgi:hypothetical protein
MTPEQLKDFLDVLDSMAIMVEDAKTKPSASNSRGLNEIKLTLH